MFETMEENEILQALHHLREEHARECGCDIDTIFAHMSTDLERLKAEGWQVVAPGPRAAIAADGIVLKDPMKL